MRLRRRAAPAEEAPNRVTAQSEHAGQREQRRERLEPEGGVQAGRERVEPAPRRRALGWRTRDVGAAAVGTAGAGVILLARLVMAAAALIALLIALAIVLSDVNANGANTIVKGIHEGANFFAGAFTGLIRFSGHPKRAITVDWGIALLVYLIVGAIVSNLIAGVGRGGVLFGRSHRTAPTV